MTQNRSHAVMSQRAEPHDSLDFFPTPLWATRALFEHCGVPINASVWEPACGDGAMVRAIFDYSRKVYASDVHDYGAGYCVHDFLQPFLPTGLTQTDCEWIITNPPFRLAEQFVHRAIGIATRGVAVLVRSVFIESASRYEGLFRDCPPNVMAQFVERVPMVKGRLDNSVSSATAYCWLIWDLGHHTEADTKLRWIPPCRIVLDREDDWPEAKPPLRVPNVPGSFTTQADAARPTLDKLGIT